VPVRRLYRFPVFCSYFLSGGAQTRTGATMIVAHSDPPIISDEQDDPAAALLEEVNDRGIGLTQAYGSGETRPSSFYPWSEILCKSGAY
jgi:hypothetical protein